MPGSNGNNITAFIVCCNESHLLPKCLESVKFCNEIILVDLESTDNIEDVAKSFNVTLVKHSRVPVVEIVYQRLPELVTNKWVLILDPDEVVTPGLADDIVNTITNIKEDIAVITVPWQFYFKGRKLKGTTWGGILTKMLLINTEGYVFTGKVHDKGFIKQGYLLHQIVFKGANYIQHYWMVSYHQLIEKHKRYILKEGERMFSNGLKYRLSVHIKNSLLAFRYSYLVRKGYKEGLTGLYLSFFWSWYVYSCWKSLFVYQRRFSSIPKTVH